MNQSFSHLYIDDFELLIQPIYYLNDDVGPWVQSRKMPINKNVMTQRNFLQDQDSDISNKISNNILRSVSKQIQRLELNKAKYINQIIETSPQQQNITKKTLQPLKITYSDLLEQPKLLPLHHIQKNRALLMISKIMNKNNHHRTDYQQPKFDRGIQQCSKNINTNNLSIRCYKYKSQKCDPYQKPIVQGKDKKMKLQLPQLNSIRYVSIDYNRLYNNYSHRVQTKQNLGTEYQKLADLKLSKKFPISL